MFNSAANNGNLFAAVDYIEHKAELIDTGVQLLEYEGGTSYHGKSIVMDDNIAIIGSFNVDMRSTYIDTELMIIINSESVNQQLRANMEEYEKEAALAEGIDTYSSIPEGMEMQDVSDEKQMFLRIFGGLLKKLRF